MISTETKKIPLYVLPNIRYTGFASNFGGPLDKGVSWIEGLALYEERDAEKRPELFMTRQHAFGMIPEKDRIGTMGTLGLARCLNPEMDYCACWWDYGATPKEVLRNSKVFVQRTDLTRSIYVHPVDCGPARRLNRLIDLSPHAFNHLKLEEDKTEVFVTLELPSSWKWSDFQPRSES